MRSASPIIRRSVWVCGAALLSGCTTDLLPGESVVGVDVPATRWDGAADERFGASVAVGWATAPAVPELLTLEDDGAGSAVPDVPALWVGQGAAHVYAAGESGMWWRDGALQDSRFEEARWAAGPAGIVVADTDGWWLPEQQVGFAVHGIAAIALGEARVLAAVCAPACTTRAWTLHGEERPIDLPVGAGGALGEWRGVAWAGDPADAAPDGAGQVCNEQGLCIDGMLGDHLGRTIGGGYAAGTFNKWVVPARARLVPLPEGTEEGPVFVLESGAEDQPLALAGDGASLWIGAPYFAQQGQPGGVVYRVDLDASANE